MLHEIEELNQILAPKLFGKPLAELDFFTTFKGLEGSERFKCSKAAAEVRLEALKRAGRAGREYSQMAWPEFLMYCEEVIEERYGGREPGED